MRKRILIIIIDLLAIILLIMTNHEVRPIAFNVSFINSYKSNIIMKRLPNKCNISIKTNYYDNKLIIKDLLKNGYVKSNKSYIKNMIIEDTCNNLYEDYVNNKITFSLNGEDTINIEALSDYIDEKYTLKGTNGIVTRVSNVDTKTLGNQYVIYKLSNSFYTKYIIRNVEIKDTTKPSIELKGKDNISIYLGDKYEEPGYVASDNYDGDITNNVTTLGNIDNNRLGKYELVYNVKDSSGNEAESKRIVEVKERPVKVITTEVSSPAPALDTSSGLTYINGVLVVNKTYGLPENYNPGTNSTAYAALVRMQNDASVLGYNLRLISGFRSYQTQKSVYYSYVNSYGQATADTFSARPGHSEHQTGLAFDVGNISESFGNTESGKWLADNCHLYGFIIRYPKGKQGITGYKYEPWHIRYLGVEVATSVKNSGLTLEEYLGI